MAYAASNGDGDGGFNCPICLDIFENPIQIPCGHSFCEDCIDDSLSKMSNSLCPVCRISFITSQMKDDRTMIRKMERASQQCSNCNKMIAVSSLKSHKKICSSPSGKLPTFKPVPSTSLPMPSIPNRSTFSCPYCEMPNLDREGLISHVNSIHRLDNEQVVCPVCASMPWGNPEQKSSDFKQHLNMRHKFNYDTYVDFQDDEEAILQSVLEKSITDM